VLPPESLSFELLESIDDLERLAPEWTMLWRRCGADVFEAPAWAIPFARWFVDPGSLRVWSAREGGRLVGVLPFYLHKKRLLLLGSGIGDWLDAPMEVDCRSRIMAGLFGALEEIREQWDACEWQMLREDSVLLRAPEPDGWRSATNVQDVCPFLPLHETLAASLPHSMLVEIEYGRRRAAKIGDVEFELATRDTLEAALENLFQLHGARWEERGGEGVLAKEDVRKFHLEAAARLLELEVLCLLVMKVRGRAAGVFYGFLHRGRMAYYLGGFEPELAKVGPGKLVIAGAMEMAIHGGAKIFDFLRGAEPYKYLWGAADRPGFMRTLTLA
jgi:CelD/BcsL family acetyltransferase involved in cellulose biosynthesis